MSSPTREEALGGLRAVGLLLEKSGRPMTADAVNRAIAYLEGLPAKCLEAEQEVWDTATRSPRPTDPRGCR